MLWRRGWDSNPRALSDNTLSRRARYDHFGTSPLGWDRDCRQNFQLYRNLPRCEITTRVPLIEFARNRSCGPPQRLFNTERRP